ncbi:hypothetical protein K469DRAFT_640557 [Zopfia rhizophila CBS 207.26]|uniref:UBA domain-containing protein n=1 Tax=Zopfia rhizophila CBS 207.26 TaxID=1314779 RepID=A0A6A6DJV5_9PEZI|nr:hypothetical protein K469DRAFT_640557 [Zopfia rhizophila CBS 207.26]
MDDLVGLDWSAPNKPTPNPPAALPPFRQNLTPQLSGRSTPLSAQQSGNFSSNNRPSKAPSKPATPANDSFAGLVSLNSTKSSTNSLSLQERQKQLQEEKLRQEVERRKQYDSQFGEQDSKFWDTLGSGKNTPEPAQSGLQSPAVNISGRQTLSKTINKPFAGLDTSSKRPLQSPPVEDDLLSAFSSAAPVDSSSHFPPPASFDSGSNTPAFSAQSSRGHTPLPQSSINNTFGDDDDPFGLNQFPQKPASNVPAASSGVNDDDDILGLLGKPVAEFQKKQSSPVNEEHLSNRQRDSSPDASPVETDPRDKAVAELVDMGFPADKSAIALAQTESGMDIQAAVGWLLNQAHAEAKQKTQKTQGGKESRGRHSLEETDKLPRQGNTRPTARDLSAGGSVPAWMKGDDSRSRSGQRRHDNPSAGQEKDVSQYASDLGSSLFKSANSLWKSGQKKVQKAVAEFHQEGDQNVPKWMRNAQEVGTDREVLPKSSRGRNGTPTDSTPGATDEALMLEPSSRPIKPPRPSNGHQSSDPHVVQQRREQDEVHNGFPNRMSSQSPSLRQQPQHLDKRPTGKLTRQDVEEQSAQAYVSPARRKKATRQPQPQVDLFSSEKPNPSPFASRQSTPSQSNSAFFQNVSTAKSRSPTITPPVPKPKPPPRQIPPASSSALTSSASHRQKGSEAFKRGDYSAAHTAYTAALAPLPQMHPITIIVLCNRAVTNIKVGDPKAAVSDADAALAIIGVSKGEDEKIALGGTEGEKNMKEFFGKALMRKAEALEHMEKWADAGKVWREAVEAGVGGSISIQGRNRCDKAAGGGNKPAAPAAKRPPVRKPPPPKPSALTDLGGGPHSEAKAVKKLREANAAAEKADDEKFALTDQVDAKLTAWKGTKADNLRALLGSLDKVLWPEAGWQKVNMGDLVMPNKVKIIYMKAIAKVHPDKISQTATTEQRMISAAVFSTLNEAWDTFKKDNGL